MMLFVLVIKYIIRCSFLAILSSSSFVANGQRNGPRYIRRITAAASSTVWDIIQHNNNDLSTFASAITVAEMEEIFEAQNDPSPVTVVFAPTNEAFEKLGKEYVNKLLDPTFSLHLRYFIRNHGITNDGSSSSYLFSSPSDLLKTDGLSITTLSAETIYVTIVGEVVFLHTYAAQRKLTDPVRLVLFGGSNNEDNGAMAENGGSSGVVHEVDTVLAPVWYYQDIMDVLTNWGDEYSTLRKLIADAGLTETVRSLSGSTFIAPTNNAFTSSTLDYLTNPDNEDALSDVLMYHILPDVVVNAGVLGVSSTPVPTALHEEDVLVGIASGTNSIAEFSFNSAESNGIYLSKDNIIYSVDSVLLPPDFVIQSTDNRENEDTTDEVPEEDQPDADVDSSPKETTMIPPQPDIEMPAQAADLPPVDDNMPSSPADPATNSDGTTTSSRTCKIRADIKCYSSEGVKCGQLQNPIGDTCTGKDRPDSITFRYTGGKCQSGKYDCHDYANGGIDESEVYVEVHSGDNGVSFYNGIVQMDEIFEAQGAYRGDATISIYTVARGSGEDNTIRGLLLSQTITVPTRCEDGSGDLALGAQYGALNLVGFSNDAGSPTMEASINISYIVVNAGTRTVVLDSSIIRSSSLEEPTEALEEPQKMEPISDSELEVYNEPVSFDWRDYDTELYFNITAWGHDEEYTGYKCMAGAAYYF